MVGVKREHIGTQGGITAVLALKRTLLVVALFLVVAIGSAMTIRVHADSKKPVDGQRVITLYDRGLEQSFMTNAATVGDALKSANIEIDARDRVEPALDETLVANEYKINVYRARPLLIVDGMLRQVIMTAAQVPEQVAKDAGITLHDEDVTTLEQSDDLLVDRAAEKFIVTRATSFKFTLYGKTFTVYTQADTVADMLKDKGITLGKNDRVSVPQDTEITEGMSVRVWREGKQTITVDEDVKFEVETIQDADRPVGYRQVKTPGVKGQKTVTYEVIIKDGKESSRKEVASVVKKQPKKQVEVVGAKLSFSGDFAAALAKLRQCEAGGNYSNKRNPLYRGAYQFSYQTWGNYGGYYDPADAPAAVQDQAARQLYERRGWQPWPHCGAGLPDSYR